MKNLAQKSKHFFCASFYVCLQNKLPIRKERLIITAIVGLPMCLVSGGWFYFLGGMLFMHTGACGGDFALISFLYEHRGRQVFTYDDMSENKSYFYSKI
jgi:hypothetical protein